MFCRTGGGMGKAHQVEDCKFVILYLKGTMLNTFDFKSQIYIYQMNIISEQQTTPKDKCYTTAKEL